jgi:type I restriction enzyme S subunit
MELKRLGNVIKIISGSPFDSKFFNENKEGMPLIRVRDVNSGFAGIYYSGKYEDTFIINDGDLLIGLDGDFKCVEWKYGKALLNQRVCKLIPIEGLVSREYILHFLPQALNEIHRNTNYTTVKHLSTKTINEIKIPLPQLSDQIRIAEILSQAESLIAQRKQSICLLDELLKSTFLEMFGDPVRNEKGWKIVKLSELCSAIADIDHKMPKAIEEGGYPFISAKDLLDNGTISFDDVKRISENDFKHLSRKIKPQKGDIIYSRIGAKLGKARIVDVDFDFVASYSCCTIKPKTDLINTIFLNQLLDSPYILKQALKDVRAIGVPDLGMDKIRNFDIITPKKELQIKYAKIVEKVEELKTQYKQSLIELQNMYGILSQKAFKGELNIKELKIKEKV